MLPAEKATLGCNCIAMLMVLVFWGAVTYGVVHYALKWW